MHLTLGILRQSQAVSHALSFFSVGRLRRPYPSAALCDENRWAFDLQTQGRKIVRSNIYRNLVMTHTSNLQLLPFERIHIEALLRDKRDLAEILHVSIPDSWPNFPEAFSVLINESDASEQFPTDWHGYFFILPTGSILVGNGGFKGKPDKSGTVEIGYEIASEHWNRGFATEAVQGMIAYAFAHPEVQAVIAHTLAQINASNTVLKKVGMTFIAELDDPEEGRIWRWQINRNEYHPS